MDIVAIGSPSGVHAEQAIAAARRGLHVLVEKPLDITTAKIDRAPRARRLAPASRSACSSRNAPARSRRAEGAARRRRDRHAGVRAGQVRWYRPPEYYAASRWRGTWALDGGGALMNQGIHTVDLLLWLLGPVGERHGPSATRLHKIEVEDTAAALLEFANGALGTVEATTAAFPGFPRRIEVTGTKGSLVHEDPPRPAVVADATPHRRVLEDSSTPSAPDTGRPATVAKGAAASR